MRPEAPALLILLDRLNVPFSSFARLVLTIEALSPKLVKVADTGLLTLVRTLKNLSVLSLLSAIALSSFAGPPIASPNKVNLSLAPVRPKANPLKPVVKSVTVSEVLIKFEPKTTESL